MIIYHLWKSIDTNKEEENEYTRTNEDQRIQHINLKNVTFADAILKSNILSAEEETGKRLSIGI